MIQDPGPKTNLGFGLPVVRGESDQEDIQTGIPTNAGGLAKALNDKPLLKFAAVATASLVAMQLAGKVSRSGGYRFAEFAQEYAKSNRAYSRQVSGGLEGVRKLQKTLDEYEGLRRTHVDPTDTSIFVKRGPNGEWLSDKVERIDSAAFRAASSDAPDWLMRDEIQQRLVRQARRLPYELPGFYVADKLVIDPLLGNDQERKVNWANPVDVVGDFAWESVKNVAFAVVPFETATGAGAQTYRRMRKAMASPAGPDGKSTGVLTTQVLLEELGIKFQDILDKTIRGSKQSTGAFASAIEAASQHRRSVQDLARGMHSTISAGPGAARHAGAGRRAHLRNAQALSKDFRDQALDSMPGPFSGMYTGFKAFKKSFKEIGETYDDWQAVTSGRVRLDAIGKRGKDGLARRNRLEAYMVQGGGGQIEAVAQQLHKLGINSISGPEDIVNTSLWNSSLAQVVKQQHYQDKVIQNLVDVAGLPLQDATKFVQDAARVAFPSQKGSNSAHDMIERIRFGKKAHQASGKQDWFTKLTEDASQHGILGLKGVERDKFERAITLADNSFWSKADQDIIKSTVKNYHSEISKNIAPNFVGQNIASRKVDFFALKQNLGSNENYLVRNTARVMGIKPYDGSGNPLDLGTLKNQIIDRGIDANNSERLLGYLVDKKAVKAPWSSGGWRKLFGLESVSVQEGLDSGYFSGYSDGVQSQIKQLLGNRAAMATSPVDHSGTALMESGLSALKLPGVYRGVNGNIIDVGRIKRGVIGAIDAFATETKIPILNFNPAQLGFYNSWMSARKSAPIQFAGKHSAQIVKQQPYMPGDQNGLYMFMRTGTRSKGRLLTSRSGTYGEAISFNQMPGEYKPFLTNRLSMTGKYAELFLGKSSIPSSKTQGGWRKLFDVSTEQESNLFFGRESLFGRVASALRGDSSSRANPRRSARLFAKQGFDPNNLDQYGSEALDGILRDLKGYGLQGRVMQTLRRKDIIGENPTFDRIIGFGGDALPEHSVPEYVAKLLREDLDSTSMSRQQKSALATAQGSLRNLLKNADEQTGYWDLPVPKNIKTTGVARRIHQLKSELSEYMVVREGVMDETKPFSMKVASVLKEVDELHLSGAISSAEKAEARASALSLQLQFSRTNALKGIDLGEGGRLNLNKAILSDALNSGDEASRAQVRGLLEDYGRYGTEHQGLLGKVIGSARSKLAPAAYRGPVESDPMGSAYTFIPTISSGFRNNPLKTAKGLFGGSWSDPEAITSGTIYSTHLAARINKYFESVGLGLDLQQYKGPFDFYARGLIGKRVLPAFAAGTTAVAIDRTLGGMVNKDEQGNRVYSPLLIGGVARGVVEGQSLLAGLIPGGQRYSEKKEELLTGEVPIRQGRYWLLNSNTPFKGGRIQYFRPSWYQRLKAGGEYTPEMNQTPMERLAFGYDFSPLRPLDPYRFERQNYSSRPYPVSGDYFTGPFGPLTSVLNNTLGRVLKPTIRMHEAETAAALASYSPVGQSGAVSMGSVSQSLTGINASYAALANTPGTSSTTPFYGANGYTNPRGTGSATTIATSNAVAGMYTQLAAGGSNKYPGVFAPMLSQGLGGVGVDAFGSQVVPATAVGRNSSVRNRLGRTGFETQEMAGIYGFGFASVRSGLGIGGPDFTPQQAILESSSRGYSSSRSFWNLNLGGAGDLPLPIEGRFASLEFSEIIRRFVPKEQQGIQYINGIPNTLGTQYPWLPGEGSFNNLRQGDPYNIPDATIRLPGTGRDRVKARYGSTPGGQYGPVDIHAILGDLDPFGDNYRQVDQMIESYANNDMELAKIMQTRAQVRAVGIKNEFTPYKYKYLDPTEMVGEATLHPVRFSVNKLFENIAHKDTFFNSKFLRTRTALEDWERDNVYGSTYPSWDSPYESFIKPIVNRATQRDPLTAASAVGAIGYMFGASTRARAMGSILGGAIGASAAMYGSATEAITGSRFIPKKRKKELMLEEQADILSYTHSMVNASRAMEAGDTAAAQQFLQASSRTMYGANLNATPEQLALSVPSRKREHFEAMMYAPEQERKQILSTAGRLERRLLQAAWGMKVEKLPDLQTYFEERELPAPESSFWSPYTDMDAIKIKMGQQMGLDMSQMGYYPQQLQEANLINPAYPAVFSQTSSRNTRARLDELLRNMGIRGSIEQRPTPFSGGDRFELSVGTY